MQDIELIFNFPDCEAWIILERSFWLQIRKNILF